MYKEIINLHPSAPVCYSCLETNGHDSLLVHAVIFKYTSQRSAKEFWPNLKKEPLSTYCSGTNNMFSLLTECFTIHLFLIYACSHHSHKETSVFLKLCCLLVLQKYSFFSLLYMPKALVFKLSVLIFSQSYVRKFEQQK